MGTITKRKRADGSVAHMARIRIKEGGLVVHSETETLDREAAAKLWMKNRETELGKPGALEKLRTPEPTFAETIQKYIDESRRELGTTKAQVLKKVAASSLSKRRGSTITSADWVRFGKDLGAHPQTVDNYFSHISSIYRLARPAWNYQLDPQGHCRCTQSQQVPRPDIEIQEPRQASDPRGVRHADGTLWPS